MFTIEQEKQFQKDALVRNVDLVDALIQEEEETKEYLWDKYLDGRDESYRIKLVDSEMRLMDLRNLRYYICNQFIRVMKTYMNK